MKGFTKQVLDTLTALAVLAVLAITGWRMWTWHESGTGVYVPDSIKYEAHTYDHSLNCECGRPSDD